VSVWAGDGDSGLDASFDADGRSFSVTSPGIIDFKSTFSASIIRDGQLRVLSSTDGEAGYAGVRFVSDGVDVFCRLEQHEDVPGVMIQVGVRNTGETPLQLVTVTPLMLEGQLAGKAWEWLVTALDQSSAQAPPVVAVGDIGQPFNVHEHGGLYRHDGAGFFFGPMGIPAAYIETSISQRGDGAVSMVIESEMSGVRVDPGETRWGQQVVLLMEPPSDAYARWAGWVAQTHGARTAKGALVGWKYPRADEAQMLRADLPGVVEAVRESEKRLRPGVVQVDPAALPVEQIAGSVADASAGLMSQALRISAVGARAGLNLASIPGEGGSVTGWDDLLVRAGEAVRSGYSYLEIDDAMLPPLEKTDPRKTVFEVRREGFVRMRKAIGEDVYLLFNTDRPDRASVGSVDASRAGIPVARDSVRQVINDVLRSYALHDRWFAVDNDVYYMESFGVWPLARTWMSMVGLSCGAAITSDPWQLSSFKPHWRSVEVMTPPAGERTVVLDLCTSRHWPRLVGRVQREWGEYAIALLWNPGAVEQSISLEFAEAGLDPERRYAVWSFWDNRFLGVTRGSWTTPSLAPATSQHLRFTDLDREPELPVLIGSSLHIYCGAAEITEVKRTRSMMQIVLSDAGARAGDLYVYSRWQPVLKTSVGCTATGVEGAGENVWRIGLQDRQAGETQRIELGILLPTRLQSWFWVLIAAVVVSLLIVAWRFVVGLQLKRASALEHERTRIAGDIHDDVGANLTQISILSGLAARSTTSPEDARRHNLEMLEVARQTVQGLEEIVWSINPKGDSLKSLADFVCRRAEGILEVGKVECRIVREDMLPNQSVTPRRRHGLVLAVKEALNNVLKHADATRVLVRCEMVARVFEVSLTDDGCGFDPAESKVAGGRQGSGLDNMRKRLADLGGECHIESRIGEGTFVCFRLPLD